MAAGTVTVGVTGHRTLPRPEALEAEVDVVLDGLSGGADVHLLTSLAEGADRLVAHRVLARVGGTIGAVLPLEPDDYEHDFADEPSRHDFRRLLSLATSSAVVDADPAADRIARYEAAGYAVVEGSDVLVALWDGEPARGRGGTALVIEHARQLGRPVTIVAVPR
jgi:hypothetical protein